MRKKLVALVAVAATASLAVPAVVGASNSGSSNSPNCASNVGERSFNKSVAVLLTNNRLLCTRELSNQNAKIVTLSGFTGSNTSLVGIDYRPQDGLLYGVGNQGGVYTVNPATGALTLTGSLTVALSGARFGVDFNPAADRLRIVSDNGQNLRHQIGAGTTTDTPLSSPPAAGPKNGVVGAAYTNNDLDAQTGTTLFDLDLGLNQIAIQSPANSGQLVATGNVRVSGVTDGDLDVYSTSVGNSAYALLVTSSAARLVSIDLLNGQTFFGRSISGAVDLALPINQ